MYISTWLIQVSILRKSVVMTTSYCLFYSNSRCKICLIILSFYYLFAVLFFLWVVTALHKNDVRYVFTPVVCRRAHVLFTLFVDCLFGFCNKNVYIYFRSHGSQFASGITFLRYLYNRKTRKSFGASKQKVLNWIANIG